MKREGYPLMETENVLRDFTEGKKWTYRFPRMFVYVSADKKIFICTNDHTYDLRIGSFKDYFSSNLYKSHALRVENCNECVRTCVRGYSHAYDLKLNNLLNLIGDAKIVFSQNS